MSRTVTEQIGDRELRIQMCIGFIKLLRKTGFVHSELEYDFSFNDYIKSYDEVKRCVDDVVNFIHCIAYSGTIPLGRKISDKFRCVLSMYSELRKRELIIFGNNAAFNIGLYISAKSKLEACGC